MSIQSLQAISLRFQVTPTAARVGTEKRPPSQKNRVKDVIQ